MEDVRLRTRHVKAITGFADGNAYYLVFGMTSEVKQCCVLNTCSNGKHTIIKLLVLLITALKLLG